MEREQRSEGLLRDFIRANCQRMKHELAKRDCGLGQYRRDSEQQSMCEADTHTHTHKEEKKKTPGDPLLTVTIDRPNAGQAWQLKTTAATEKRNRDPSTGRHQVGHLKRLQQSLPFHFSFQLQKANDLFFIVSQTGSPTIVRT